MIKCHQPNCYACLAERVRTLETELTVLLGMINKLRSQVEPNYSESPKSLMPDLDNIESSV